MVWDDVIWEFMYIYWIFFGEDVVNYGFVIYVFEILFEDVMKLVIEIVLKNLIVVVKVKKMINEVFYLSVVDGLLMEFVE